MSGPAKSGTPLSLWLPILAMGTVAVIGFGLVGYMIGLVS